MQIPHPEADVRKQMPDPGKDLIHQIRDKCPGWRWARMDFIPTLLNCRRIRGQIRGLNIARTQDINYYSLK